MRLPLPILIIVIILLSSISIFILYKIFFNKKDLTEEDKIKKTAQDFINVKDIKDCFLFTNDKKAFLYLEVEPISMEMLSENEQKIFTRTITSALSSEKKPFKTISFPKPVDLSFLIYKYEAMYSVANTDIEKKLIREEILKMKNISLNNEATEFKFYFVFWDDEKNTFELLKRAKNFKDNFDSTQIKINIISEKEIYRLCNLMNNPNYTNLDNYENFDNSTFPIIKDY